MWPNSAKYIYDVADNVKEYIMVCVHKGGWVQMGVAQFTTEFTTCRLFALTLEVRMSSKDSINLFMGSRTVRELSLEFLEIFFHHSDRNLFRFSLNIWLYNSTSDMY